MTDPTIQFGILKCRDLVQLYYGARLVAFDTYSLVDLAPFAALQLLGQDPRRIKYKIRMANIGANPDSIIINNSFDAVQNSIGLVLWAQPHTNISLDSDFFTDLDAVTGPLFILASNNTWQVSTCETFLTPAPIDEGP